MSETIFYTVIVTVFICVGLVLLLGGLALLVRLGMDAHRFRCTTTGRVVDQHTLNGVEHPIIEYAVNEHMMRAEYNIDDSHDRSYSTGSRVTVHYNPGKPEDFVLNDDILSSTPTYAVTAVLGAIFLFVVISGLLLSHGSPFYMNSIEH